MDKGGSPRRSLPSLLTRRTDSPATQPQGFEAPADRPSVNRENRVTLSLLDSDHRPQILFGLEPDGWPRLRLQDKDGDGLFQVPMELNPTLPSLLKP